MVTITAALSGDMTQIALTVTTDAVGGLKTLEVYLNDSYLNETPEFSPDVDGDPSYTTTITLADLSLTATDTIRGIVTFYATDYDNDDKEFALYNLYYVNLCLANMIVYQDAEEGFNVINTIYLLVQAIMIYLPAVGTQKVSEALNAYSRVVAMCEKNPAYLIEDDIEEAEQGAGYWIVNGTYIVNK